MESESNHFDFLILGTSLPLSILSASLSRSGFKVLQIDNNPYYGQDFASLNLLDLRDWILSENLKEVEERSNSNSKPDSNSYPDDHKRTAKYSELHLDFPYFRSRSKEEKNEEEEDQVDDENDEQSVDDSISKIPNPLLDLSRHFSISLKPLLISSVGALIDDLISSKVNDYCTFRLLGSTLIFNPSKEKEDSSSLSFPESSFKTKDSIEDEDVTPDVNHEKENEKKRERLLKLGELNKVPSSKSDIFSSKSITSLIEKRKLMKLLLAILNDEEWFKEFGIYHPSKDPSLSKDHMISSSNSTPDNQTQIDVNQSLPELLSKKYKLSNSSIEAICYAIALCPSNSISNSSSNLKQNPNPSLKSSLLTAQNYLKSLGRYGDSPFLVSQYGGSSEILEGFNRNSAVFGTVYIIGKEIEWLRKVEKKRKSSNNSSEKEENDQVEIEETTQKKADDDDDEKIYKIKLNEIEEEFTSDWLISSNKFSIQIDFEESGTDSSKEEEELEEEGAKQSEFDSIKGILIFDRSIPIGELELYLNRNLHSNESSNPNKKEEEEDKNLLPPETAMIVFPPGSLDDKFDDKEKKDEEIENQITKDQVEFSTTVLMMGEGTFSCPKGMYVYYLCTFAPKSSKKENQISPKKILEKVRNKLLGFAKNCPAEYKSKSNLNSKVDHSSISNSTSAKEEVKPIMEFYYRESLTSSTISKPSMQEQVQSKHLSLSNSSPISFQNNPTSELPNLSSYTENSSFLARQLFYIVQGLEIEEALEWSINGRPEEFKPVSNEEEEDGKRNSSEWNGRAGRGWDDPIEEARRERRELKREEEEERISQENKKEKVDLDSEVERKRKIKEWFGGSKKERNEREEDDEDD